MVSGLGRRPATKSLLKQYTRSVSEMNFHHMGTQVMKEVTSIQKTLHIPLGTTPPGTLQISLTVSEYHVN